MLETTMRRYREDLLKQDEELGEERGQKLGLRTSIMLLIANRFGEGHQSIEDWLGGVSDLNRLQRILFRVSTAQRMEDIRDDLE